MEYTEQDIIKLKEQIKSSIETQNRLVAETQKLMITAKQIKEENEMWKDLQQKTYEKLQYAMNEIDAWKKDCDELLRLLNQSNGLLKKYGIIK